MTDTNNKQTAIDDDSAFDVLVAECSTLTAQQVADDLFNIFSIKAVFTPITHKGQVFWYCKMQPSPNHTIDIDVAKAVTEFQASYAMKNSVFTKPGHVMFSMWMLLLQHLTADKLDSLVTMAVTKTTLH